MPKEEIDVEKSRGELLQQFLNTSRLPLVKELKGNLVCSICHESYLSGGTPEVPIKLGCGHIFGQNCLLTWLNPFANRKIKSCPEVSINICSAFVAIAPFEYADGRLL